MLCEKEKWYFMKVRNRDSSPCGIRPKAKGCWDFISYTCWDKSHKYFCLLGTVNLIFLYRPWWRWLPLDVTLSLLLASYSDTRAVGEYFAEMCSLDFEICPEPSSILRTLRSFRSRTHAVLIKVTLWCGREISLYIVTSDCVGLCGLKQPEVLHKIGSSKAERVTMHWLPRPHQSSFNIQYYTS